MNKDYAKIVKKNHQIPQLKTVEALALSRKYTEIISLKMEQYNKNRKDSIELARKKIIRDSIACEKALAKIKEKNKKKKKIENSFIKLIIIGNPFQQERLSYIVQYVIKVLQKILCIVWE